METFDISSSFEREESNSFSPLVSDLMYQYENWRAQKPPFILIPDHFIG